MVMFFFEITSGGAYELEICTRVFFLSIKLPSNFY